MSNDIKKNLKLKTKAYLKDNLDDLDFFQDLKYNETNFLNIEQKCKEKKRKMNLRYLAIAASIMAIFILSSTFAVLIANGSVDAAKFRLEQQLVKLKNQFTNNEEKNKSINENNIIFETNNYYDMDQARGFFPSLFNTDKVPSRFDFKSLKITKSVDGSFTASFIYNDDNNGLLTINQESIPQEGFSGSFINTTDEIKTESGTIYFFENSFGDGTNAASYLTSAYITDISGVITIKEIKELYNVK